MVNVLLITLCINLWNRCDFSVDHLEAQKDIHSLSTFYSHIKTSLFQLVILVSHNMEKGYFKRAASSVYSKMITSDKNKVGKPARRADVLLSYTAHSFPSEMSLLLVHNLQNMLLITVYNFHHSQKPSFYSPFYTRFIHMCLYFDFNGLAVL